MSYIFFSVVSLLGCQLCQRGAQDMQYLSQLPVEASAKGEEAVLKRLSSGWAGSRFTSNKQRGTVVGSESHCSALGGRLALTVYKVEERDVCFPILLLGLQASGSGDLFELGARDRFGDAGLQEVGARCL